MMKKEEIERLRRQFPAGTRVELIDTDDQYGVPPSTKGTVEGIDGAGDPLVR